MAGNNLGQLQFKTGKRGTVSSLGSHQGPDANRFSQSVVTSYLRNTEITQARQSTNKNATVVFGQPDQTANVNNTIKERRTQSITAYAFGTTNQPGQNQSYQKLTKPQLGGGSQDPNTAVQLNKSYIKAQMMNQTQNGAPFKYRNATPQLLESANQPAIPFSPQGNQQQRGVIPKYQNVSQAGQLYRVQNQSVV